MIQITLLLLASLASTAIASPCPYANLARRDEAATSYQGLSAAQQLDTIWSKVMQTQGSTTNWPFNATKRLFDPALDLKPSLEFVSDEVPKDRVKLIHTVGTAFKATFTATPGSPYTGLFQGSSHAIIRYSLGGDPATQVGGGMVTGAAIKMLRDNTPSANLLLMFNTLPQQTPNFFQHDFSTHITPPLSDRGQAALVRRLEDGDTKWSNRLGTSDASFFDEKGRKVENPVFPFQVIIRPDADVLGKLEGVQWTYNNTFDILTAIPANTVIWNVYATPAPASPFIKIGTIKSMSEVVKSVYADVGLFYRHQKFDEDLELRPEWTQSPTCRDAATCVNCNDDKSCIYLD
ncbi:hypothetical protein HDV05_000860 [Chytridiales sp. JEL 0842]|nr:hypothetical protein HDV05_000860 [Chytridiales sp. JEL 0842]